MTKKKIIGILIFGIINIINTDNTFAQGPPIFTDTPVMLGLDGGGVRTFGRIINNDESKAFLQVFVVPYNIGTKWQVGIIAPYLKKSPNNSPSNSGFGDLKLYTKYQLYQKNGKGKTFRILAKLTETLPTGNTTDTPQIGTGLNQTALSLVAGKVTTKYGLYSEVGYNITSGNAPDNLSYNLAMSIPLLAQQYPPKQINVSVDLNGNLNTRDNLNTLFISPGIQFIVSKAVLFETGVQLPILQSTAISNQTNYTLTLGTRILLF